MSIDKSKIIDFPTFSNQMGCLSVVEGGLDVPFDIKRVYYLHQVPLQVTRGVHAHKQLQQLLIPIAGRFTLRIDDGQHNREWLLDDPTKGIYICPMIWREITTETPGSVLLVLASEHYQEADYIHEYDQFIELKNAE